MNEISKNLSCLIMRNGIEVWKEKERLENLKSILIKGNKIGFINVDDEMINSVDIVGIFNPETMENLTRRKNGQWKCEKGIWHDKGFGCDCLQKEQEEKEEIQHKKIAEAIRRCGKCDNGWIRFNEIGNPIYPEKCKCVKNLI